MYLKFFKLSRKPFNITPDPDFFYLTASARKTYDRISNAIPQQEPCLLLSGEPGTGKTALLKRLMTNDDSNVRWIFINKAQLAGDELPVFISQALGLSEENCCADHFSEKITTKIAEFKSLGSYPVLIIDEADHFESGTLQKLWTWHALNQTRGVPLTIILSSLKSLAHTFYNAGEELFAARPENQCELKKFDLQETRAVIAYRLEMAGYSGPALFEDEALKLIHNLSGGIPRVINQICDLGLVLAANNKQPKVTRQIIQEASEYLLLNEDAGSDEDPFQDEFVIDSAPLQPAGAAKVPPQEYPANDSESVKPARPQPERRVLKWRWAVAGLLIMLGGGGTWLWMKSAQIQKIPEIAQRLILPAPSNDDIEGKKMPGSPPAAEPRAEKEPGPLVAQIPTEQPRPVSQGKELQAEAAAPKTSQPKISSVTPPLQKPEPAPKVGKVPTEPEASRSPTSEKKRKEKVRTVVSPKGAALIAAVENGNQQEVRKLIENGARVDSANATGETALMKAAWAGRLDITALLLSHTPRINRQSREGWTALFYAAVKGHKHVVALLLDQGARPDLADQDGRTPLMAAAWNDHADIAKLLLDQGVNPNRKNRDGWTPLMFAALEGHIDMGQILLRHGANPSVRNNDGSTSAQLAAHQGHTRFLSLLSTHGGP